MRIIWYLFVNLVLELSHCSLSLSLSLLDTYTFLDNFGIGPRKTRKQEEGGREKGGEGIKNLQQDSQKVSICMCVFLTIFSMHGIACDYFLSPYLSALPQSNPRSLGPKLRHHPQVLPCIPPKPVKGFLGIWEFSLRPPPPRILKSIRKFQSSKLRSKSQHTMAYGKRQGKAKKNCQRPTKTCH